MADSDKQHWEEIYSKKEPHEVSWTQKKPGVSAHFFEQAGLASKANLIDVGSGRKGMVNYWLKQGYQNITALDLSQHALDQLAGSMANTDCDKVALIQSDVLSMSEDCTYDYWNDRAVFHFLTSEDDQRRYRDQVERYARNYICIGTFAKNGPLKCSGLEIVQYEPEELAEFFKERFEFIDSEHETHVTPFGTSQEFIFCLFKRR